MPQRIFHKVYDADYVGRDGSPATPTLQTSSVVEATAAGTVLIGSSREQVGFDDRVRGRGCCASSRPRRCGLFPFLAGASVMRSVRRVPAVRARPPARDRRRPAAARAVARDRARGRRHRAGLATAELLARPAAGDRHAVDLRRPHPFRAGPGRRLRPRTRMASVDDRRAADGPRRRRRRSTGGTPARRSPACCWPPAGSPGGARPPARAARRVLRHRRLLRLPRRRSTASATSGPASAVRADGDDVRDSTTSRR